MPEQQPRPFADCLENVAKDMETSADRSEDYAGALKGEGSEYSNRVKFLGERIRGQARGLAKLARRFRAKFGDRTLVD